MPKLDILRVQGHNILLTTLIVKNELKNTLYLTVKDANSLIYF